MFGEPPLLANGDELHGPLGGSPVNQSGQVPVESALFGPAREKVLSTEVFPDLDHIHFGLSNWSTREPKARNATKELTLSFLGLNNGLSW